MGEDRLGKFIKEQVHDHQTATDLDAMWQGIKAKQEEKPKRRWFWWFSLLGVLLVGSGLTFIYLNADKNANPSEATLLEADRIEATSSSTNVTTNTASMTNQIAKKEAVKLTQLNSDKPKVSAPTANKAVKKKRTNSVDVVKQRSAQSVEAMTPVFDKASVVPTIAMDEEPADYLTTDALTELNARNLTLDFEARHKLPSLRPKKLPARLSFGLHTGLGVAQSQLSSKTAGETNYINLRNGLETPEEVWNIGLDIQYRLKSNIYVKTGIGYEQITERFDFSQTGAPESFYNESAVNTIYRRADGTTETLYGTNSTKQDSQTRKIYNRYRSVDWQLLVGYEASSSNRFNWFVEGGLLVNIAFLPGGEIIDTDGETIIDLANTDILKKNIGSSLYAGIGAAYQINRKWSIWASPNVKYALSSMTSDAYALNQSFVRSSLQMGIRRSL